MIEKSKQFWYLYSALVILVLIRIIPFLYPASRTWGFNHLIFLPSGYSIAFFTVAAVALILPFVKKSEIWGERFIDWFSGTFFESPRKYLYRVIFILSMTILFIVSPAPTHFLGDGYSLVSIFSTNTSQVVRWSESGIFVLLHGVLSFLDSQNVESSRFLYQIISVISGMVTIWFYFKIAQIISKNTTKRFITFTFSLLSGSLLLFFGYVENYPIIWLTFTAYFYFGLKYLKTGKGLLLLWASLVVGSVLHLLMAILFPATIFLLLSTRKWQNIIKRYRFVAFSIAAVCTVTIVFYLINAYYNDLGLQVMFLDFFKDKVPGRSYTLFGSPHLIDILNELLILSPLLMVLPFLISINSIKSASKRILIFLGISAISYLMFLFVIDPKLGMPRDWDLFSVAFYPTLILLIFLLHKQYMPAVNRIILSSVVILTISCVPYLLTNLNELKSVKYAEYMASLDFEISRKLNYLLSEYHHKKGDYRADDSLQTIMRTKYPEWNKCYSVAVAFSNNDINKAEKLLNTIELSVYNSYYQKLMGRLQYFKGNYDSALIHYNNTIQLREFLVSNYTERADIYFAMGRKEKGFEDLRYGYKLDNTDTKILDLFIIAFSEFGQYDSSISYCKERIYLDSTAWVLYYELAKVYTHRKNIIAAKKYAHELTLLALIDTEYIEKLNEVTLLINKLENNKAD